MTELIGVRTHMGLSFVRPERVIAVQAAPTGGTLVLLEGGATVMSMETTTSVAGRIKNAEAGGAPKKR